MSLPTKRFQSAIFVWAIFAGAMFGSVLHFSFGQNISQAQAAEPGHDSRALIAKKLLAQHKRKEALVYLHSLLKDYPNDYEILRETGILESQLDDRVTGRATLRRCLKVNPKSHDGQLFVCLASDCMILNSPKEALEVYNQGLKNIPGGAALYCERGCIFSSFKDYTHALEDLDRAIQIEPNCAHFHVERGEINQLAKHYPQALADYTEAIKLGPDNVTVYAQRAEVYKVLGKPSLAQKDLEKTNQFGLEMLEESGKK